MSEQEDTSANVVKAPLVVRFPWLRISFFLLTCGLLAVGYLAFTNQSLATRVFDKLKRTVVKEESSQDVVEEVTIEPEPVVELPKVVEPVVHTASSGGDIRKMSKGFTLETKVTLGQGDSATEERLSDDSYVAKYELLVNLPKPSMTLESLEKVNPHLGKVLPGLEKMLDTAKVSPYFHELYNRKIERLKDDATELDELLTRHNLYDCETILSLKHPSTGRRVLLVQAEMDVVSDGSDGDRLPTMPDKIVNSTHYQPMTSYGWKKTGTTINPLIPGWKNRIRKASAEIALSSTSSDRRSWLKERIKKIEREIDDMESRSFLIADYDPFIVMPVAMVTSSDKTLARVGDYAAVIYNDKIYPAIVGDAGPSHKIGEASLRMCKELDPKANSYNRPVSDLAVTYIVFPRTADKFQEPDYARWYRECSKLLTEIGGIGSSVSLHQWKNTFPVKIPADGGIIDTGGTIIPISR